MQTPDDPETVAVSVPRLGVTCGCGHTASVACATVADIPAAQEQFAGWGYDARGFVCCPACLAIDRPVIERRAPKRQQELFEPMERTIPA